MQVSHPPQCRAVDLTLDGYPGHFHTRDRPYTRRRDVIQIPTRERWSCPNEGCGRQYKRTSSISIGRHKRLCHNRPTVAGRSIFHYCPTENTFSNSGPRPIAAMVVLRRIETPIYKSDTLINLNTGGYGADLETCKDGSPEVIDDQRGQSNFDFQKLGVSAPVPDECKDNLDSQSSHRLSTTCNFENQSKVDPTARTSYTDPQGPKLQPETPSTSSLFVLESLPEAALSKHCHDLLLICPMPLRPVTIRELEDKSILQS
jgi:hypothetical protein